MLQNEVHLVESERATLVRMMGNTWIQVISPVGFMVYVKPIRKLNKEKNFLPSGPLFYDLRKITLMSR